MSNNRVVANSKDAYSSPLCYLMALCPFLMGLIQEYQIAIATIVVLVILVITFMIKKEIRIQLNVGTYLIMSMILFSVISVFSGVVKGESIYGVLRMVSVGIWVLYMMQISNDEKELALGIIPNVAVLMTIICIIAYLTGVETTLIFEEERMSGFFGYSNTFSLYLLLALIIHTYFNTNDTFSLKKGMAKDKKNRVSFFERVKPYLYPIVMIVGIFWSGSRTTLVITVFVMIALIVINKRVRVFYSVIMGGGILGAVVFAFVTGSKEAFGRFLTISASSSTLLGRVLYWKDGLRQLLNYPLGLGYEGFYFTQGGNQTGVYETLYVHNDWIQMAIDFGGVFFVAFVLLFIYQIVKTKGIFRFIIIIVGLHMIMDFDMQYMIISWIVLMCMNWETGKEKVFSLNGGIKKISIVIINIAFILVFAWLGLASLLYSIDEYQMSASIFPWGLRNQEMYLIQSETPEEYEERAINTLKIYSMDSVGLDVMALCAAERNEYMDVLEYKKKSLYSQKYRTEVYDDYVMMMDNGANYYKDIGNQELYYKCVDAILDTKNILKSVEDDTDNIAYMISDKPNFDLSEKSNEIIHKYELGGNYE